MTNGLAARLFLAAFVVIVMSGNFAGNSFAADNARVTFLSEQSLNWHLQC
jgi:hypothetical protein